MDNRHGTMNVRLGLHGPVPAAFDVRIHQVAAPGAKVTPGLTVHVPVPPPHPTAAAGYVVLIFAPVLASLTQS